MFGSHLILKKIRIDDIFLVGLATMYIQMIPGIGETQPIIYLLACVLGLVKRSASINVSNSSAIFIALGLILICYSLVRTQYWGEMRIDPIFRSFVFLFIIVCTFFWRLDCISKGLIRFIINFFVSMATFQYLAPNYHNQTVGLLIPRSVDTTLLGKLTILSPEPSYMACIIILVYIIWVKKQMPLDGKLRTILTQISLFTVLVMLGSALSFLFALIIFIHIFRSLDRRLTKPMVVVSVLLLFSNTRFYNILMELTSLDMKLLFFIEPSGTSRFITSYLAIKNLFLNPLGQGLGDFQYNWSILIADEPMLLSNIIMYSAFTSNAPLFVHAAFLNLLTDVGVPLLVYLVFVIIAKIHFLTFKKEIAIIILILIFGFYQSSYLSPFLAISLLLLKSNRGTN